MEATRTYNLANYICIVGVYQLKTAGEGDFVKVTRDSPDFKDKVDVEGRVIRWAQTDPRGTIEISLMGSSQENAILSGMQLLDMLTYSGIFPVTLVDKNGSDTHMSALCWIPQMPDANYAKTVGVRVWKIRSADVMSFLGGNG